MAVEIFPSSFRCDCGQELHFTEKTVKNMKNMSKQKYVRLGEEKHTVLFYKEKAIEIHCPTLKECKIIDPETDKLPNHKKLKRQNIERI